MSTICVIGSNSECVPFVLDKLGFCSRWRLTNNDKPHGMPPQPMFLVSFVGNRYILI